MQPPLPEPWAVDLDGSSKKPALPHSKRWGWFLILLWFYSLLVMGGVTLVCFLPASALSGPSTAPASPQQQSHDMMLGGVMLLPVLLFLVLAAIKNFRR